MKLKNSFSMLVGITLFIACTSASHAQVTAIKAGKLVDPEVGTTVTGQVILVESRTIKAVGGGVLIPAGATVIDLSQYTVLPGLFDAHTHLCLILLKDYRDLFFTTLTQSDTYRAIQGVANAREMLESGFTTVRDVGNAGNYADTSLRIAIEQGLVPGPTIINAGRIIAPFGGQYSILPGRREFAEPEYFFADTKDELKKAVRENIHFGAQVIKIVVDDQPYIYSVDDIKFIVDEAGKAGLKVAAHAGTDEGTRNAAEAGVASIEHGFYMSDETLQIAKRNNVTLVGTDLSEQALVESGLPLPISKQLHKIISDRLKRAHRIGVTMAYGTDVIFPKDGQTRGTLASSLIDSFIEAGVPPKDVLRIMTTNAARLLGVDKRRGAIKPGMAADIIAVPENPLDNILTLKQVHFVMKDGKIFKQAK